MASVQSGQSGYVSLDADARRRFEQSILPEPNSGCWIWTSFLFKKGYGCFNANKQSYKAHRLAYEKAFGAIGDGLSVCHRCDVRSCVNPDHLYLGSNADNMGDRRRKGIRKRLATMPVAKQKHTRYRHDPVPVAELRKHLDYDPIRGWLIWRDRPGRRWNEKHRGKRAGHFLQHGYRAVSFCGKPLLEHRAIWAIYHGRWPQSYLDHINHDRGDNRIANLREVTASENQWNKLQDKRNRSGEAGVSWDRKAKKWKVSICSFGQRHYIGLFHTPEEAAAARAQALAVHRSA